MRVLHFIPRLSGGGAERQLSYLACAHAQKELEVHVAYLNEAEFHLPVNSAVKYYKIVSSNTYDPRIIIQLVRLAKKVEADIIQSWALQSDICAAIVAATTRIKWIIRESNAPGSCRTGGLKAKIRMALARFSSAIVANSNTGLKYWRTKFPTKSLHLIRNGFPVDEIVKAEFGSKSCWLPNQIGSHFILFVGRLHYQKNIAALVAAMPYIPPDVHLVICGVGQLSVEYKNQVEKLNLASRVHFLGHVEKQDVWQLMRASSVFVLVSHFEGFPNVLIEAMLNKCPLVVSDIEPHREFLDDSSANFVDRKDPLNIAHAIEHVLGHQKINAVKTSRAYEQASKLTIESMADSYHALYRQILINSDSVISK